MLSVWFAGDSLKLFDWRNSLKFLILEEKLKVFAFKVSVFPLLLPSNTQTFLKSMNA